MISQKKYWDEKIKQWTQNSYQKEFNGISLLERAANLFRGPITKRMEVALEIVGPKAKGKIIADFGCGLGNYCFEILKYKPKKVIGIDISKVAIKEAGKKAKNLGVKNIEFVQKDLGQESNLPEFDIAVGLGFVDYLNKQELKKLFKTIDKRYFLFCVFEKKLSVRNFIHAVYVKTQRCPGAFKYSRKEILETTLQSQKPYFLEKDKSLFITNFPK